MENRGPSGQRRWSPVRKAQVLITAFFGLLTIGMVAYDAIGVARWEREHKPVGPQSTFAYTLADTFLVLMIPADDLARALGIEQRLGYWGLRLLAVVVNTAVAFGLGSLIGWLVVVAKFIIPKFRPRTETWRQT